MGKSAITISGQYKNKRCKIKTVALLAVMIFCVSTVSVADLLLAMSDTEIAAVPVETTSQEQWPDKSFKPSDSSQDRTPQQGRSLSPSGVRVYSDLEYARVDDESLRLDLYMPENPLAAPPLIVWIHGGGWTRGDKAKVNSAVTGLSAKGYAVASINYRLGGLGLHPKQIHDVKGAVRWLRANAKKYGYDATRIGAGGGSAGGHLALLLALSANNPYLEGDVGGNLDQSSTVQAVLDLYGPSALQDYADVNQRFARNKSSALLQSASPLSYLTPDAPPLLIMHGNQDRVVPLSQSEMLHQRYQQAGLDSTLHIIEGAAHGGKAFKDATRQQKMQDFFDLHIKNHDAKVAEKSTVAVMAPALPAISGKQGKAGSERLTPAMLHGFHWMIGPRAGLRGSNEKFESLLRVIDQTLSANPLITGVYLITHWKLIEQQEGVYDFERLERVINLVRSHGRYYKLALAPGIYTPEWLYQKGAKAFVTIGSNPKRVDIYNKPVKIPLPWDTIYQDSYFAMLQKVAERYAGDQYFRAITVTAATFMSPEWHLPRSAADREKWQAFDNYTGKLEASWKDILDYFAKLFPSQVLIIEASSYPVGDKQLGDAIIDYGVRQYAGRFAVQINQLSGRFDQIKRPTYAKLLEYRKKYGSSIIIGLQNLKGWSFPAISRLQGSMEMSAFNYLQADAGYWELWYGDAKNKATTEQLQTLIEQGRRLGLNGFRNELRQRGKYIAPVDRRYRK